MNLYDVAGYFDNTPAYDGYLGTLVGKVQPELFDSTKRDGLGAQRRNVSTVPTFEVPARRVLTIGTDKLIFGENVPDYFQGEQVRNNYITHKADRLGSLFTPKQVLSNSNGNPFYTGRVFTKLNKQVDISSDNFPEYELIVSSADDVNYGLLIKLDQEWLIVSAVYETAAGFQAIEAESVADSVPLAATYHRRTYKPLTDSYDEVKVSLSVIKLRWEKFFKYSRADSPKYKPGDVVVIVQQSDIASVVLSDTLTVFNQTYNFVAVSTLPNLTWDASWADAWESDGQDCLVIHARSA